jgi:AraC family transcriptional activator of pobA
MQQTFFNIRASDSKHKPRKGVHRHDHYEILIIKSGGGVHMVDFEQFDVTDNQVYFLRPGQVHQFLPNSDAVFYFVAFDKDQVMLNAPTNLNQFEFFQSFNLEGPVVLDEVDSLINNMVSIQKELQSDGDMQDVVISSLVTVFLIKIQRKFKLFFPSKSVVTFPDLVIQFNKLLDNYSFYDRFVKEYAQHLHVSPTYLNDLVREYTGHPASYWINKKLVTISKQLLLDVSVSLKQVSSTLGYTDSTHFARFFKQHVALTPTEYRQSLVSAE